MNEWMPLQQQAAQVASNECIHFISTEVTYVLYEKVLRLLADGFVLTWVTIGSGSAYDHPSTLLRASSQMR